MYVVNYTVESHIGKSYYCENKSVKFSRRQEADKKVEELIKMKENMVSESMVTIDHRCCDVHMNGFVNYISLKEM